MARAQGSSLRLRMLTFVCGLVVISVLGSTLSLIRISEVKSTLDQVNRQSIPLNRLLGQLQTDVDVLAREMERAMGAAHWKDPRWKPRPLPKWLEEVLTQELGRLDELTARPGGESRLQEWSQRLSSQFKIFLAQGQKLGALLEQNRISSGANGGEPVLVERHAEWIAAFDEFRRQVAWGVAEHERNLRERFGAAERRVGDLRTGLEVVLVVVISLSFLMLWLGERALRPLGRLTELAREITRRGLRKEDKNFLSVMNLTREDEVGTLAQEFHRMATALLEREKTVEQQRDRLEGQNAELLQMGRLRERLQEAENLAALGRLSAQVAHEVRNPLHAIGLEAELALEALKAAKHGPARDSVQSILESVDRLEQITENYLKLSRSGGDRAPQGADLALVLESTLALYAAECQAKQVRVVWHLPEQNRDLWVRADAGILEQVIGNLLRNAIQSMSEAGVQDPLVTFKIDRVGDRTVLRVWDNGPGISAELAPQLFQPFVTTRAQGTGLGLSFVKRVVEGWGGEVVLVSPENACFELRLTAAVQSAQQSDERSVSRGATDASLT